MSVRKKAFCASSFLYVSFLVALVAGMFDFRFFLYVAPIVTLGSAIYMRTLRCPNCGQWIYKRRLKLRGSYFAYYGGNPAPRHCAWCGEDLNQARRANSSALEVE